MRFSTVVYRVSSALQVDYVTVARVFYTLKNKGLIDYYFVFKRKHCKYPHAIQLYYATFVERGPCAGAGPVRRPLRKNLISNPFFVPSLG